jgi:uncharacterized protein YjiS (DUF1127 family)
MNQSTYLNCYIRSQQSDPAISATRLLARIWRTLNTWRQRSASRHALARLSPRLMKDAGISEAERFVEFNKPFWRV